MEDQKEGPRVWECDALILEARLARTCPSGNASLTPWQILFLTFTLGCSD